MLFQISQNNDGGPAELPHTVYSVHLHAGEVLSILTLWGLVLHIIQWDGSSMMEWWPAIYSVSFIYQSTADF